MSFMKKFGSFVLVLFTVVLTKSAISGKTESSGLDSFQIVQRGAGIRPQSFPGKITPEFQMEQCAADEGQFSKMQNQMIVHFERALQSKSDVELKKFFAKNSKLAGFNGIQFQKVRTGSGLSFHKYQVASQAGSVGISSLSSFLGQYKKIKSVDVDVDRYLISQDWRDKKGDYNQAKIYMTVRVSGSTSAGKAQSDVAKFEGVVSLTSGHWKFDQLALLSGERVVASRAPAFEDITTQSQIDVPIHLRREAIRRGGYSVSVTDYNGDGVADLYFGSGGKATLWKGSKSKDGLKFALQSGSEIPQDSFVKTSVFADFDNDGDQDLVVVRFVDGATDDELVFYRNDGSGKFTMTSLLSGPRLERKYAMPAAVGDYNKDGFLDLYVGFPGKRDFTTLAIDEDTSDGKLLPHGLFINSKGQKFTNLTQEKFKYPLEGSLALYPHSALAFDYNQDQQTDIIVIDDRNNLSPAFKNTGKGFEQTAEAIGIGNHGYGMSIAVGDYNADGLIDIALTNVKSLAEKRVETSCQANWNLFNSPQEEGLRLFANKGGGQFVEVTDSAGFGWPGAATGGLVFFDYDNDGYDDLYVVNGLWSGTEKGNDLDSLWAQGLMTNRIDKGIKYSTREGHSLIMNTLIQYHGSVDKAKTVKGMRPSLSGFQRNRLYRNNGDGTFTDVASVEGVDDVSDGYAVVTMDTNKDGRQELLLRNADPGTADNQFPPVQLFKNRLGGSNKSITLTLAGSVSSKDAIGTEVVAEIGNKKVVRQLIANNGPQQAERTIHFGLGVHPFANLKVSWPNGKVTYLKKVQPGFHQLIEPGNQLSQLDQ